MHIKCYWCPIEYKNAIIVHGYVGMPQMIMKFAWIYLVVTQCMHWWRTSTPPEPMIRKRPIIFTKYNWNQFLLNLWVTVIYLLLLAGDYAPDYHYRTWGWNYPHNVIYFHILTSLVTSCSIEKFISPGVDKYIEKLFQSLLD